MSKPIVYTAGVYDLFHVGHVRMLQGAAALGETLIVGVSSDELVASYKGKAPVMPYEERREIIQSIKGVDLVVQQRTQDKFEMWTRLKFDRWVVGDDWIDDERYQTYQERLSKVGVETIFLPYTQGVSSTLRRQKFDL